MHNEKDKLPISAKKLHEFIRRLKAGTLSNGMKKEKMAWCRILGINYLQTRQSPKFDTARSLPSPPIKEKVFHPEDIGWGLTEGWKIAVRREYERTNNQG